jgi:uncharacterized protein YdeI (YjbR/CyaY-like superfamily)
MKKSSSKAAKKSPKKRASKTSPPKKARATRSAPATPKTALKRPVQPMPAAVRAALTESKLMDAYRKRPPYQRNDYLWWIAQAKLLRTKDKRLSTMLRELRKGNVYMNMAWSPTRR